MREREYIYERDHRADDAYEYQKTLNRVRAHNPKLTWNECVKRATMLHGRKSRKMR